jgi:hypothetical protein
MVVQRKISVPTLVFFSPSSQIPEYTEDHGVFLNHSFQFMLFSAASEMSLNVI